MPPLYPKLRERPLEFRINYEAPLADGLVFAGLGGHGCVGSMVYPDSSLYGNHGRLTNMDAATDWVWVPELSRFAVDFDGSNDYIPIGNINNGASKLTISAWTWLRTATGFQNIINKNVNYCFRWRIQNNGVDCWLLLSNGTSYAVYTASWTHPQQQWGHFLTHATTGGGRVKWYYNGSKIADVPCYTSSIATSPVDGAIGSARPSPATEPWKGILSDVSVWSRILSDNEIAALADPSNVDLRVGGVPLILPPRRRFWPVVSEQALPKMVPWHLFQQVGV